MEKKILCIVRASTERQETESQKKELIEFCITKGFVEDEMEFIEVAGASARKLNKKYIQMLEDIKATLRTSPTIKAVALWHLNRLGRVKMCLTEMENFFVENKIQLYVKEGFDTPLLKTERNNGLKMVSKISLLKHIIKIRMPMVKNRGMYL